jgi:hypothetical protein
MRDKTAVSVLFPGTHKAFELAHPDTQTLGRLTLAHAARHRFANQKRAVSLLATHRQNPSDHLLPNHGRDQKGTF